MAILGLSLTGSPGDPRQLEIYFRYLLNGKKNLPIHPGMSYDKFSRSSRKLTSLPGETVTE